MTQFPDCPVSIISNFNPDFFLKLFPKHYKLKAVRFSNTKMPHVGFASKDKIDLMQSKIMKYEYIGKVCHMTVLEGRRGNH